MGLHTAYCLSFSLSLLLGRWSTDDQATTRPRRRRAQKRAIQLRTHSSERGDRQPVSQSARVPCLLHSRSYLVVQTVTTHTTRARAVPVKAEPWPLLQVSQSLCTAHGPITESMHQAVSSGEDPSRMSLSPFAAPRDVGGTCARGDSPGLRAVENFDVMPI